MVEEEEEANGSNIPDKLHKYLPLLFGNYRRTGFLVPPGFSAVGLAKFPFLSLEHFA